MTLSLSFLSAVALAGVAGLVGAALGRSVPAMRHVHVPRPIVGGLLFALAFLLLRALDVRVEVPASGDEVDVLVGLLTTNMGLHVTPSLLRQGARPFLLFIALGAVLFFVQLAAVLPVAALGPDVLRTAVVAGPLSLVGAPFNLNPPSQTAPVEGLFGSAFPALEPVAQGVMGVGLLAGLVLAAAFARWANRAAGVAPGGAQEESSPSERRPQVSLYGLAEGQAAVLTAVLALLALAVAAQGALLRAVPGLTEDLLPVILIGYLFGAATRLLFEGLWGGQFPEDALTALLLGPTMSLVFAYGMMAFPLHHLGLLTPRLVAGALVAAGVSLGAARLAFPLFRRVLHPYDAAVVATAFLAVTTGWGLLAMGFLRRFIRADEPVEPMPVILPLNAFYLFPWIVALLTHLVLDAPPR